MEEKAKKDEGKAKKAAAAKRLPIRKPAGESSTATCSKKSRIDDTSGGEINPNICCTYALFTMTKMKQVLIGSLVLVADGCMKTVWLMSL